MKSHQQYNITMKLNYSIIITLLLCSIGFNIKPVGAQATYEKSIVPKCIFSNDLQKQYQELDTNILVRRFKKSRKDFESDKFRPVYHFTSPESKLNDPNGLCYWRGQWHLFYQGYPPEDPRQHWGHAVSNDLIHWKDLPYAIYPGPEWACFSGSALVEDNRVIAMYHGKKYGNMVASSSDPLLLNWEKLANGKALIPIESTTGFPLPYNVHDAFIWEKDSVYYSLSNGRSYSGPGGKPLRADYLFRSKDLLTWEYMHEFVEGDR
ncbi:glycoside hydrolase family 32 protein, partial [Sunxiuqinia sp. A32]|uniref:glycoside hydrolase family 32 protein n=1 Tax=Sunxiuqinia sp. A32 TaxID=3461496 RepID=UPI004045B7FF